MKPIIVDINELNDSVEVYEAEPHRFILYSSYAILVIFLAAILWMSLFRIDIVVKCNGMFRSEEAIYEVSSGVSGTIREVNVEGGQYVEKGDLLYSLDVESLEETIQAYNEELENANARLEILRAYGQSLEGEEEQLHSLSDNPYYEEFTDKRSLLFSNIESGTINIDGQRNTYQRSVESIRETIAEYEQKKTRLLQTKECIRLKEDRFSTEDSYYSSIVQNYLAACQLTASQYDSQIQECERLLKESEASIASLEGEKLRLQKELEEANQLLNTIMSEQTPASPGGNVSQNTISGNQLPADNSTKIEGLRNQIAIIQERLVSIERELTSLRMNKDTANQKAAALNKEKEQALANLELEQLSALEQQIENINNTILSLESNETSAQIQLDSVERQDTAVNREIQILTEKGNVAAEILSYESKLEEYEQQLKNFDIQNSNCNIVASTAGYFYGQNDLKVGAFIQEGTTLGRIYPQEEGQYYAEIYVENIDIGKLKEGQEVKFEIAAYPSDEYGYFTGKIANIAKDISVDSVTGSAYYIIRVLCDNTTVINKQGEEGQLMNGMACQARVVVDDQSVLKYLLQKIDLID